MPTILVEFDGTDLTTDDLATFGYWLGLANLLSSLAEVGGRVDDLSGLMNSGPMLAEQFGVAPGIPVTTVRLDGRLQLGLVTSSELVLKLLALVRDWTATRGAVVTAALQARLYSQLAESGVPSALRPVAAEFVQRAPLPVAEVRLEA